MESTIDTLGNQQHTVYTVTKDIHSCIMISVYSGFRAYLRATGS